MINVEKSRSGHLVIRKNGRLLGSSFDPTKEACAWATKAADQIKSDETAFILGLASGYHVMELRKLRPLQLIVVIECDPQVVREAYSIFPELHKVPIVVEQEWLKLADNHLFRDHITDTYKVLTYGPSYQIDCDFFKRAEMLLMGRDKTSFLIQLKMRPELLAILDSDALEKLGDDPISIKTMQKLFSQASLQNHERRLWRILEELVV